jgi:AraC family transcriptional regulator
MGMESSCENWADTAAGTVPPVIGRPINGARQSRMRVLDLPVGFVEDIRTRPASQARSPEGLCTDFQICLPYAGLFVWHVGKDDVVGDANQIVFVRGGEPFRMSSPSRSGYAELIITPELGILSEIARLDGRPPFEHPLFRRRAILATPRVQAERARFFHWLSSPAPREYLEEEERLVALVRAALHPQVPRLDSPTAASARLIRRAKEVLEERLTGRLRLADVSRAVGASPAYLTDLFTRTEGVPLHQYLTQLRLARALLELPHADDLTTLALDLGFSSHSHFTFTFRRAFGSTPSTFREHTRHQRAATETRSSMRRSWQSAGVNCHW